MFSRKVFFFQLPVMLQTTKDTTSRRWEVGGWGGGLSQIVNDIAWSHLRIGSFVAESNGYASVVKFLPLAA